TPPARIARLPPLFTPSRVKAPAKSRLCLTWVNRRADPWSADGSRRRTRAEHGSALHQTKAEHGSALQEGLERLPDVVEQLRLHFRGRVQVVGLEVGAVRRHRLQQE